MDRILNYYQLQESDSLYLYWMKEILVAVIIFAVFWVLAKILRYLLITWAPRFTAFTATDLDYQRMSDEDIEKAIADLKAALRKSSTP